MKRAISLILVALMMLLAVPAFSVAAADGTAKSDYVVYLNGTAGADANDGKSAATAVATLAKAIEVANTYADAKEVVVVVTGATTIPDAQHVLPANTARIILTSVYDGTDYKAQDAYLATYNKNCAALYFNGEFTFEYIKLSCTTTNAILVFQYNSFTMGDGIDVAVVDTSATKYFPIILGGCNTESKVAYDKAVTPTTFTNDVNVVFNSGDWQYFRAGDRDSLSTYDGTMTININGGTYNCPVTSATGHYTSGNLNAATGKNSYGENAKIVMNLNGGVMNSLTACCYTGTGHGHTGAADITVNFYDGFTLTNKFVAAQGTNNIFNGKITINLYGGDLTGLVESKLLNATTANGGTGTVTVNYNADDAKSAAAFKALKDVCLDDTDVIYGELAAEVVDTTAATVDTTAAVVDTTAAVVDTTAAVVDTTAATGEVTPPTGDASLMVVFAAAAVLCAAAVIVIKKREN